jgi:hypothetical protein
LKGNLGNGRFTKEDCAYGCNFKSTLPPTQYSCRRRCLSTFYFILFRAFAKCYFSIIS